MHEKTDKNILIAFLLNICFSIFEIIGGVFTGSISIISDAIHDFGDAISIGISFFLERKSKQKSDNQYTYGYIRYSLLGAFITSSILIVGSILVIYHSILRILNPVEINYNGMILFAIVGFLVNLIACLFTKHGESLNQKAVFLHMMEDTINWIIVLIGSIVIKFTDFLYLDSFMSILIAFFLIYHASKHLKEILDLFLEKVPKNIVIEDLKKELLELKNVLDVHHIHIWSMDSLNHYATMHVITNQKKDTEIKKEIRKVLEKYKITHVTIEIEEENECKELECKREE